jgi:hypothetical protein
MIGNADRDCWRGSQRFVNAAEIVVHDVQCDGRNMAIESLGKTICQTREAARSHADREIARSTNDVQMSSGAPLTTSRLTAVMAVGL